MFGDLEERQQEIREKLAQIIIEEKAEGIRVEASANQRLKNIEIDPAILEEGSVEQLEDLLLVTINRALDQATQAGEGEMRDMMKDMLGGGGGLGGMLGNLFK